MKTHCPHCNADLRDGQYSLIIGVVIRGLYDGVAFWQCPDCGGTWPREGMEHLYIKAAEMEGK